MSNTKEQFNDQRQEILNLQNLNKMLLLRCDQKDNQIKDLEEFIQELETDMKEKNTAISKASKIIESLRFDLEKATKDIKMMEEQNNKTFLEKKKLEKEVLELQKEICNHDTIKKSEIRAKSNSKKLNEKLESATVEFEVKEQELLKKYQDIERDNHRLEKNLEDYLEQITELKEQYRIKNIDFLNAHQRIQFVTEENVQLKQSLADLQKQKDAIEAGFEKEMRLIKREAENNIRFYQHSLQNASRAYDTTLKDSYDLFSMRGRERSPLNESKLNLSQVDNKYNTNGNITSKRATLSKPSTKNEINIKKKTENLKSKKSPQKNVMGIEPAEVLDWETDKKGGMNVNAEFLKITLADSLERERKFVEIVEKAIAKEVPGITNLSEEVLTKDIALRPEIEGWMMRNEEAEQRLFEYSEKIRTMEILLRQYQTLLQTHEQQRETEKQLWANLLKEYESMINFVQIELEDKNKLIETTLPQAEKLYLDSISACHESMNKAKEKFEEIQQAVKKSKEDKNNLADHAEELKKKNNELLDNYNQSKDNHVAIANLLGINLSDQNETFDPEKLNLPGGMEQITAKIQGLLNTEKEFKIHQEEATRERIKLLKEIGSLEAYLREANNEKNLLERERMETEEQLLKTEKNLKQLSILYEESRLEMEQMNRRIQDLLRSIEENEKKLFELNIQNKNSHNLIENQEQIIKDYQLRGEKLREEINALSNQILDQETLNNLTLKEKNVLEDELNKLKVNFDKSLRDFESTQSELQSKLKSNKLLELRIEELQTEYNKLKKEYDELTYITNEIKSQVHSALTTLENKNESIKVLENQLHECRLTEENLRNEISFLKKETLNNASEMKKEIISMQSKANVNQEKMRQFEAETKEWEKREKIYKQQIDEMNLKYSKLDRELAEAMRMAQNSYRSSRINSNRGTIEAERDNYGSNLANTSEHYDNITDMIEKIKKNIKEHYRKKIDDYDALIRYLKQNILKIFEPNEYSIENEIITDISMSKRIVGCKRLNEHYINIRNLISNLTKKRDNNIQSDADFLKGLCECLLNKLTLGIEDQRTLEEIAYSLTGRFTREKHDAYSVLHKFQNSVLDIMGNSKVWENKTLPYDLRIPSYNKEEKNPIGSTEIYVKIFEISNQLNEFHQILEEKAMIFKNFQDSWQTGKETSIKTSTATKAHLNSKLIDQKPSSPISDAIHSLLNQTSKCLQSQAGVIKQFSEYMKEISSKTEKKSSLRTLDNVRNQVILDEKYSNKDLKDTLRNLEKILNEETHEITQNRRIDPNDTKYKATAFLKEFFNEVQDAVKVMVQNANKLEDKLMKNPKLAELVDDPQTIYIVLEENMNKNNKMFLDCLKKDLDEYQKLSTTSNINEKELLESIYTKKASLHCVEKICEESLNIKNALNLLDLNIILNIVNKDKDLNYEYVKNKAAENNEGLETIIKTTDRILNYSDTIQLDTKAPILPPKQLYSKIIENYQSLSGISNRYLDKKGNLRVQIYELLKENAGLKIGINSLLYILYKYKIIVQDMQFKP